MTKGFFNKMPHIFGASSFGLVSTFVISLKRFVKPPKLGDTE
jgi:hypothetical protein